MSDKQGFFSRQDLGGNDPEKFRLSLQVANLKIINAELLEALKNMIGFADSIGKSRFGPEGWARIEAHKALINKVENHE